MQYRLRVAALAVGSLSMVATGATVVAASPARVTATNVTYKACLTNHDKLVNVTASPEPKLACPQHSHRVKWNQRGRRGPAGLPGTAGAPGATVLNGNGAPSDALGRPGDFYIDVTAWMIYGPKGATAWPTSGHALQGPRGAAGPNTSTIVLGHLDDSAGFDVGCGSSSGPSDAVDCSASPQPATAVAGVMPISGTISNLRVQLAAPAEHLVELSVQDLDTSEGTRCLVFAAGTSCLTTGPLDASAGDRIYVQVDLVGGTWTTPPSVSFGYTIVPD